MQQSQKKNLYFTENASDVISDILKKHNIEDTEEEVDEKLFGDNNAPLRGEIIAKILAKLSEKEVSENDALIALQKELSLPKTKAEMLIKDVILFALPLATPLPKEDFVDNTTAPLSDEISPPQKKDDNLTKTSIIKGSSSPNKRPGENKINKQIPNSNRVKKSDVYREPIE